MNAPIKTIFYADDDADDLAMFRQSVQDIAADYSVLEAFDGLQALEKLREMEQNGILPSLIILDINMPRMNGKELLKVLQNNKAFSAIPIVLFSTSSNIIDRRFSEAHQVVLITKPFGYKEQHDVAQKLLSYCVTKSATVLA